MEPRHHRTRTLLQRSLRSQAPQKPAGSNPDAYTTLLSVDVCERQDITRFCGEPTRDVRKKGVAARCVATPGPSISDCATEARTCRRSRHGRAADQAARTGE